MSSVIGELTQLLQQLRDVQDMGNRAMPEGAETIEVDRAWLDLMMTVVHDAVDLLGPVKPPEETSEEFVERMIRENSVHAVSYTGPGDEILGGEHPR